MKPRRPLSLFFVFFCFFKFFWFFLFFFHPAQTSISSMISIIRRMESGPISGLNGRLWGTFRCRFAPQATMARKKMRMKMMRRRRVVRDDSGQEHLQISPPGVVEISSEGGKVERGQKDMINNEKKKLFPIRSIFL